MYKKVLKLTATTEVIFEGGKESEAVRLSFQNYKDGYTDDGSDIIIYRREEKGYIFDYDECEYFDCLPPPTEDEVIFRGHLADHGTFSEYYDSTVEPEGVYAYWVGKGEIGEALTGPVAIKIRDGEVWWRFDRIISEAYAIARDFPEVEIECYGETALGRPLVALKVGNRERMIAAVGAVHAGESGPEILLGALREILTESPHAFDECGIAVFPVTSADNRELMASGAPWYSQRESNAYALRRAISAPFAKARLARFVSYFNSL